MPRTKKTTKKKKEKKKRDMYVVSGMRKRSVARATIRPGTGIVRINQKPIELFDRFHKLSLTEPLMIAKKILGDKMKEIDINVNVRGGGVESQIEASRLAIARALVLFAKNPDLKTAFLNYDRMLLVADIRHKEMYKPGDSKARRKRQKSYR